MRKGRGSLLVVIVGLFSALSAQRCADGSRAPTAPSAVLAPTPALAWECLRSSASTTGGTGWTFQTAAPACPMAATAAVVAGAGEVSVAPGNLQSTITGTTVRLDWDAIAEPVARFLVEAGSAPALTDLARLDTGNSALSLIVNNVPNGTYYVRVRAIGSDGIPGPASNEIVVRVGTCSAAPLAPTGFAAVVNESQVSFSWVAPAGGDPPASYVIEAGSASALSNVVVYDTGTTATGLAAVAPSGLYYVRVRGRNGCAIGAASNEFIVAVGVPLPQQPPSTPTPTPTPPRPPPRRPRRRPDPDPAPRPRHRPRRARTRFRRPTSRSRRSRAGSK